MSDRSASERMAQELAAGLEEASHLHNPTRSGGPTMSPRGHTRTPAEMVDTGRA